MSSPPPTKPPRGVKQGKETSGLLMSVIRTLSASETNEQREKERVKLEKEYKKSDVRLDELVAEHAQDIMEVMQKFSAVNQALTSWGQHCDAATARLAACQGLLKLRRDDLRRLWMTARTHHYALQMLTDIERVVVSERMALEYVSRGLVLACAHTLTEALHTATDTLSHVDALLATRHHLEAKKCELVDVILARISEAVYRGERERPLTRALSARRRTALLLAELTKSEEVTDAYLQDITPEFEASLTEEDKTFETTVMISLEALGVLDQLKEATEKFKVSIQTELLGVIDAVSRRIIEEGDDVEIDPESDEDGEMQDTTGVSETGRPLARLITILADEFRACASRNKRLLQLWRAALQKHKLSDASLHTEHHYWSAVQQVLQLLLTEYLDIESVTLAAARAPAAAYPARLRLSEYFGKKRPQPRRTDLYKLTSTWGRASGAALRRHVPPPVCAPSPDLLHAALPPLLALCDDIPVAARPGGGECSLRAFITDYVRTGESERLSLSARSAIEETLRAANAWRERGPPPDTLLNENPRHRVVFSQCGVAWQAIERVVVAARTCGACGGTFALRGATHAIGALATAARHAHHALAHAPHAHASRASRWLGDDDIVRFLQALPNWRAATSRDPHTISKHELKQAYEREAEILGSSLGDGAVTRKEIISDVNTLLDVAVLCETMDWLATNIRSIPSKVSGAGPGGGIKITDKFVNDIHSAAMIFDEISHQCLLLLHLEMRIECFHYLGQEEVACSEADEAGAGGGAARLAHALLAFHEQAATVLAAKRLAYIMEGIGEMMSAAVIWRWRGGGAGSGGAAPAWLAALRHAACALRVPHDSLHRATQYLRLLDKEHQEIIQSVREKGPQFSELEYLNAFKVIGAKKNMSDADMKQALKQLSAALGHVGVTV